MKLKRCSANLILIGVTILWGTGFVGTKIVIDANVPTGLINIIRGFLFATLTFVFFHKRILHMTKIQIRKGFIAGGLNSVAFLLQTISMRYTSPSNAAFFTVSSVLMVPFILWVFYKITPSLRLIFSVLICVSGMAVLTGFASKNITFNNGDIYAILGALLFAFSLVYIANNAKDIDYPIIAFMLGITQAIGGAIFFILLDGGNVVSHNVIWVKALPILIYLGVFPSFVAQTLQIIAQQNTKATSAALIMTLEALFGSLFSILFGYDKLTWSLTIGGCLILLSLVISEIPLFSPHKRE